MSFIKRAGLYCIRQRFKTVILFLVLMLISAFILTSIAVRDAAKGATADVQQRLGVKSCLNLILIKTWEVVSKMNGERFTDMTEI